MITIEADTEAALEAAMAEARGAFDVISDSLTTSARREPPPSLEIGLKDHVEQEDGGCRCVIRAAGGVVNLFIEPRYRAGYWRATIHYCPNRRGATSLYAKKAPSNRAIISVLPNNYLFT